MNFHNSFFLMERTSQNLLNKIDISFHTAHARNIEDKKTVITRDCLHGFS